MEQNNMLTRFLQLGSSFFFCLLLLGCETSRSEWIISADWIYENQSSQKLVVEGFRGFSIPANEDFILMTGDSHTLEFRGDGEKDIDPAQLKTPFSNSARCAVVVNGKTYNIAEGQSIRNQSNYIIEKLKPNHFRFTYTFTDENIAELTQ